MIESALDTIAAIATARGTGGVGIIRISGGSALPILQAMFRKWLLAESGASPSLLPEQADVGSKLQESGQPRIEPERQLVNFAPRMLTHGWILDAHGKTLDEVLAVYMPGPQTFTGEDVSEIHCHGGKAVMEAALEAALKQGARLAGAGEFTRRAYLNGRMDLSQAEAVAEMISAPTREGVYLARNKLEGRLGQELDELRGKIDWLRASLYAAIDFPDDIADEAAPAGGEFQALLGGIQEKILSLILAHDRARLWREGALAVLAGEVNVGKSSLLNALLGRRRALVSDTPGTTRDFIEESLNLDGLPVRLVDTAGLRENCTEVDAVEAEGMNLARELFAEADLILLLLENPQAELSRENAEILSAYRDKIFIVLNKADLRQCSAPGAASSTGGGQLSSTLNGLPFAEVSAKTGQGLEALTQAIRQQITSRAGSLNFEQDAPPTLRQRHLLARVQDELASLSEEYQGQIPAELLSVRLDTAAALLADVIGLSSGEAILDKVFSSFCIGK